MLRAMLLIIIASCLSQSISGMEISKLLNPEIPDQAIAKPTAQPRIIWMYYYKNQVNQPLNEYKRTSPAMPEQEPKQIKFINVQITPDD